ERTKECFENCITKKENEYAKLWNDWYKKCEECKYDKFSYDKAYNDMQRKIKRLQAQLGDLKGKSKDTSCISDTLNPLSQKLENENVELEFQKQKANVLVKEKQKKRKLKVKKPTKVGSIERLATPKPSKTRSFLSWSPTGRFFYLKGKIITSSKFESQSDCSKGENACTSNPMEPSNKRFLNATFSLAGNSNMFWCVDSGCSKHMTRNLKLLINFVWKFLGTVRFRNDHVAAILVLVIFNGEITRSPGCISLEDWVTTCSQ
nr:integrase, catalytic region, zinc finger, CCHC-type, peptidase aspartic, catalytic [Tanacetum cinerariifolium]